jgi:hypothetical protein
MRCKSSCPPAYLTFQRNRAVLGVLAYTGARFGAVTRLRLGDLKNLREQRALHFPRENSKLPRS